MQVLLNPATLAWLFLLIATSFSGALAETHRGVAWTAMLVALIAGLKVDVFMQHFMELKHAPIVWRLLMRIWVIVATCILTSGLLGVWINHF